MNPVALGRILRRVHSRYRIDGIDSRTCRHRRVNTELRSLITRSNGSLSLEASGTSQEGRSIPLVRFGSGAEKVLLWSQMHGDEPTATLALLDILQYLSRGGAVPETIAQRCSIFIIPLLNPDGAQHGSRYTATMIDMNRDARRLRTPEARFLRSVQRKISPRFGFNLHDQELSTVGQQAVIAAIALLAPAPHAGGRMTPAWSRAIGVAATIAGVLGAIAPGRTARYDDTHEPRAFGDMMQAWGTGTVLIESGHWTKEREKRSVRRLNFVAILTALHAIATGTYRNVDPVTYHRLPLNGKRAYDVIIRNVGVMNRDGSRSRCDIGLRTNWQEINGSVKVRICEVGDLKGFGAIFEVPGGKQPVLPGVLTPETRTSLSLLTRKLGIPTRAVSW